MHGSPDYAFTISALFLIVTFRFSNISTVMIHRDHHCGFLTNAALACLAGMVVLLTSLLVLTLAMFSIHHF